MGTFENTVTIGRPTEAVFAFLADFQNIPEWNHAIQRTWPTSPGPAHVGAIYRQTRAIPKRIDEEFKVTVFEPPTRLAVHGRIGPFHATTSYLLEPTADGTRLTNTVELEPASVLLRPLGPLAVPRVKAAVARNLATLRHLLEAPASTAETGR